MKKKKFVIKNNKEKELYFIFKKNCKIIKFKYFIYVCATFLIIIKLNI